MVVAVAVTGLRWKAFEASQAKKRSEKSSEEEEESYSAVEENGSEGK